MFPRSSAFSRIALFLSTALPVAALWCGLATAAVVGPSAANDEYHRSLTDLAGLPVLSNDSDPSGGTLTVTAISNGGKGTVSIDPGGQTVSYTPGPNYRGNDTFTYTVSSSQGGTATGTVTLKNWSPSANPDSVRVLDNGVAEIDVVANDVDVDGDTFELIGVSFATFGTASVADGKVRFTPEKGHYVTINLSYTLKDSAGGLGFGNLQVTIEQGAPITSYLATKGQVVEWSYGNPRIAEGAVWTSFGIPAVSNSWYWPIGNFAYIGKWSAVKTETAPAQTGTGVFGSGLVAKVGEEVPGLTGVTFASFKDPAVNINGDVAFLAGLKGAVTSADNQGLYTNVGSEPLTQVIRKGGSVVGLPDAKIASISAFILHESSIVFSAMLVSRTNGVSPGPGGVTTANDHVLCQWRGGEDCFLLLREGDLFEGKTVRTISALLPASDSPGQGRTSEFSSLSPIARIIFSDGTQSVANVGPGFAAIRAGSGVAVPNGPVGAAWRSFGLPIMNFDGLAFLGIMTTGVGGVTSADNAGIFADSTAGSLACVARKGQVIEGLKLSAFKDPVYNGNVAVQVTVTGAGVTGANNKALLYVPNGGDAKFVARTGNEPPGVPNGQWRAFRSIALPDQLGPVFTATMVTGLNGTEGPGGVTSATDVGLWAQNSRGEVQLLVREGDKLNVAGVEKTVKLFTVLSMVSGSPGQTRSFNSMKVMTYRATFTDNSQALMMVEVP